MEKRKYLVFKTPDHVLSRVQQKGLKYGFGINILCNRQLLYKTKNKFEPENTFELSSKKKSEISVQPE
ncbi:hypothetical protein LEP1GSC137_1892 [Leptospira borgpetersenii str. Noumea 25]|uniref:Uncharacterized protein n=2 Tax=Leptospira borgpetersenii TaxID=174 RepID=A0A0E3B902_LEPBO|nr:hypothetical protein LBBP_00773 [Leptospira borgpetersenii serovar Ballum]EKP15259.1 hypothetical protein LEP1GSC128_2063 [Leptospira borgpetersenii str. 200801926]EKR00345.1 hypothetical protein LEP1GSC121_3495 [Leptospira borgpetersenii serovar Castellonis str. 200801910]EMK09026.1 hypothetical protein LEP1GSC066_3141 [Leptospira sp. serovar Kenya str. Sh9]EMO08555.1 hypothetical protein LEP1GSC137_1892 [Leptospira borgpetersenii str. Noumea 25]ENO62694.1 hypothetical protein LEP1GSC191_0